MQPGGWGLQSMCVCVRSEALLRLRCYFTLSLNLLLMHNMFISLSVWGPQGRSPPWSLLLYVEPIWNKQSAVEHNRMWKRRSGIWGNNIWRIKAENRAHFPEREEAERNVSLWAWKIRYGKCHFFFSFACSYHVTFSRMRSFHLVCDANCDSTTKCGGSLASGRSKLISVIRNSTWFYSVCLVDHISFRLNKQYWWKMSEGNGKI